MKRIFTLLFLLTGVALSAQTYTMATTSVSTCSGTFYDSGGSGGNYGNNQNLTMTFTSSTGDRLSFAFSSFAVETCCDRLYIYDGPGVTSPLIGSYASNPGTIVSTGNSLTFRFTSDNSNTNSGWAATITCTTPVLPVYNLTAGTITACSGAVYDNGGSTGNYTDNANITETFCSGTSDFLEFTFLTAATALGTGDTLFIYDGSTTSAPLLGAYTVGSTIEPVTSSGTCLTFRFKSDASGNYAGWAGSFQCTTTPASPGVYNMSSGIRGTCGGGFYDSGGSGGNYSNSENRSQTIQSLNGNRIDVVFSSFSLETCCDRLYIYDGPNTNYPLIGSYATNPGTISSTGTSLTFRFVSDGSNTYSGWAATISCTTAPLPVYPLTAGTITACTGAVYDNGGPGANYSDNMNTVQTFCSGTSDFLQFTFWTAATSIGTGDTLFIYDGSTITSPLLGAYTVGSTIEAVTSSGTCMTFRFKSDASGNYAGWAGWFQCTTTPAAPGIYNMSSGIRGTCGGGFYDSGGSGGNYANGENRTQTIQSLNGNRIDVTFSAFTLETCCDRLYIYDGPNTNYPLIGSYATNPGTISSTGTSLTFRFISDGSNSYSGWAATVSCTTAPLTVYPLTPGTITACSGAVYDNGGPANNYSNNLNTVQTFCSGTSDHLQFTFWTAATTIGTGDSLFVYDGSSTSAPPLAVYTVGSTLEPFISSGTCITFRFKSDASGNNSGWAGWFQCTTTPPSPGTFSMSAGVRYVCDGGFYDSGGSGGNYANGENRSQTFTSYTGQRISFTFSSFTLETCCDRLYVYDGPTSAYPLLGAYATNPGTITSSGTSLTFVFVSDGSNTYSGWGATISCAGPPLTNYPMSSGTMTVCDGVFFDNGGPLNSYPNNENRVMTFTSASGQYLKFDFNPNHFNIAAGDSLFIYDGPNTSSPMFAVLTGSTAPGPLTSNTSSFTFRFKSDASTTGIGWQAWISCVAAPDNNPVINMSGGVRYTCGGTFYDPGGSGGNYGNNENRTMTFYSNSGCGIRFTFNSFTTESCCDRLYVYDGPSTASPLIGTYAGSSLPPQLQSTGSALTFRFTSDGSSTYAGWNATISCPNQPLATITASGPVNICGGDSVTLTASPNTSYLWNTGATTQSITVTQNGAYWVSVANASGCTATSAIMNVSVAPAPVPNVTANGPTTFCQGGSVQLTASNGGTFEWSDGTTGSVLNVNASGNYYVIGTDANGCSDTSAVVSVTVNPAPTPVINASGPLTFCSNDSVVLSVSGGASYLWTNSAVTSSITVTQAGTYGVDVTNSFGCTGSAVPVTVSVPGAPTAGISANGPTTFCQGDNVVLTASGGSSYVWSDNSTGSQLLVTGAGSFYVVASNGSCADTSATISVVVNSLPAVTLALPQDTFCNTQNAVALSGGSPAGGSYSGPGVSGGLLDPSLAGSGFHTITYDYTDANGCNASAMQTIFVDICNGEVELAQTGFSVAPNPVSDVLFVQFGTLEVSTLRLYDMSGRLLLEQTVTGNSARLSLAHLQPGVYLLYANGNERQAIRVVKQ